MKELQELIKDAIIWKAGILAESNSHSIGAIVESTSSLAHSISLIENESLRNAYIDEICKKGSIYKKTALTNEVKKKASDDITLFEGEDSENYRLPTYFTKEHEDEITRFGWTQFYREENDNITGIYFITGKYNVEPVSNFTMTPLFHVYSKNAAENKKLFIIRSAHMEKLIEFESAATVSVERFNAIVNMEGNFMWYGDVYKLKRIMQQFGLHMKDNMCEEIKVFGWQPEGFYAYTNAIIGENGIQQVNEFGISEFKGKKFFSPAASNIYKNLRTDDDPYKSIRFGNLQHSPITLNEWISLMYKAYPDNGKYAIIYSFICNFRDIVTKIDGSCPHLYLWGEPGSGKSKMGESLISIWFYPYRKFALNTGTEFAFSNFFTAFRNCANLFNELDDASTSLQRFQALKGAFEGEGRSRGMGGSKNKTEEMLPNSCSILVGQKVVTMDNNSLVSRSIIRNFKKIEGEHIPKAQMEAFTRIKDLEEKGGFNSLVQEFVKERKYFSENFTDTFYEIFQQSKDYIIVNGLVYNERIARNYCYLLTMAKLAESKFTLPFKYADFFQEIMQEINSLTMLISSSDECAEFWRILSLLADKGVLVRGLHYEIETESGLVKTSKMEVDLTKPKRILYLRLSLSHGHYKQTYRSETGREGINEKSLLSYLDSKEYFLGGIGSRRFKGLDPFTKQNKEIVTSCHLFDYDRMEKIGYFLDYSAESVYNSVKHVEEKPFEQSDSNNPQLPF